MIYVDVSATHAFISHAMVMVIFSSNFALQWLLPIDDFYCVSLSDQGITFLTEKCATFYGYKEYRDMIYYIISSEEKWL